MEIVFELLMELLFEGAFEASETSKLPTWLRILLILLICGFFVFIGSVMLMGALSAASDLDQRLRLLIGGIGVLMLAFVGWRIWRFIKVLQAEKTVKQSKKREKSSK